MVEPKAWFIGVDWASQTHHVCVVDGDGSKREERAFRHGGAEPDRLAVSPSRMGLLDRSDLPWRVGMACTSQPSPVARQASTVGGRSGHGHLRPHGIAAPPAAAQTLRQKPLAASAACHIRARFPCTSTPMSMCVSGSATGHLHGRSNPASGGADRTPDRTAVDRSSGEARSEQCLHLADPVEAGLEAAHFRNRHVVHAEDGVLHPRDLAPGRNGGSGRVDGTGVRVRIAPAGAFVPHPWRDDRRLHGVAFSPASGRPVLSAGGPCRCRSASVHGTSGCLCMEATFPRARHRFRMSLARLRLHHGRRSGDADPAVEAVAGSDPPSRHASIGIGQDGDVHPHPPLRCGVAPSQQSVPEGCRAPLRGGGGPVGRPLGRRAVRRRPSKNGTRAFRASRGLSAKDRWTQMQGGRRDPEAAARTVRGAIPCTYVPVV